MELDSRVKSRGQASGSMTASADSSPPRHLGELECVGTAYDCHGKFVAVYSTTVYSLFDETLTKPVVDELVMPRILTAEEMELTWGS